MAGSTTHNELLTFLIDGTKIPGKKQLNLGLQVWEIQSWGSHGGRSINRLVTWRPQSGSKIDGLWSSAHFPLFIQSETQAHQWFHPLRVVFCLQVNLSGNTLIDKCISMEVITLIWLMMMISHCVAGDPGCVHCCLTSDFQTTKLFACFPSFHCPGNQT